MIGKKQNHPSLSKRLLAGTAIALGVSLLSPAAMATNPSCTSNQPNGGDCTGAYEAAGGDATTGDVTITITDDIRGSVYGGWSRRDSRGNQVTVNGGTIGDNVFGGYSDSGYAESNRVTITGGTIDDEVFGGYSNSGSARNNSVTVNGGTIDADVHGGFSISGSIMYNGVTIDSGIINSSVYGGRSDIGDLFSNEVTVNGGTINSSVYGSFSNSGTVSNNSATISGAIGGSVFGGYSKDGNASNNRVDMHGGTVNLGVYGGYSNSGTVNNNHATINGGTINGDVYGGYSDGGTASNSSVTNNNRVTINNSVTINGSVYGGYSRGDSSNNQVFITGGTINGSVAGGYNSGGAAANNNTVTISGTPTFGNNTFIQGGVGGTSSNNSLNLETTGITVSTAQFFQIYNLYGSSTGATTLTATTHAVNLFGTTVNLTKITGTTQLNVGSTITLMSNVSGGGTYKNASNVKQQLTGMTQRFYNLTLDTDANRLMATVTAASDKELVSGAGNVTTAAVASAAALTRAQNFAATDGMREARVVAGLDSGGGLNAGDGDSLRGGAFAAVTGGQLRYSGGTTVNGMSLLGGVSIGIPMPTGQAMAGVFVETGWGNYSGRYDGVSSNGDTRYFGGGLLGRYEIKGFYVEASGRVGQVENSYASNLSDGSENANYKTNNAYYGLHGGLGYVVPVTNAVNVDLSTKYFWARQDGSNVSILGDDVTFGAVNSQRWRTGARVNVEVATGIVPYIGAYYEHEFDAKAKATVVGLDIAAPSLKGSTGVGELGVTFGAPTDIYRVDVGVTGYAGKHSGATGSVKARWAF